MKKLSAFILLLSVVALNVSAQKKLYLLQHPKVVEWADSPSIHPTPPEHAGQPAVILLKDIRLDYRYEGKSTNKHFSEHSIIKVLDDAGIARFSTVEIYLGQGSRVPTIKARSISPSGKVLNVDQKNIMLSRDEAGKYVIAMAMEGIVKNSEIEFLVKAVDNGVNSGKFQFQNDIPVTKARFTLSFPKTMKIESKSYSGFPVLRAEEVNNRMVMQTELENIPAVLPEINSFYNLHTMSFEYRVSSYWVDGNKEQIKINTWNDFARWQFDKYYEFSSKELNAVNMFLSELGVRPHGNELENIRKIEQGIKSRIVLYPHVNYDERKQVLAQHARRSMSLYAAGYDEPKDIADTILTKRAATTSGYLRLFAACLTQAGIAHEMGWAWDRTKQHYNPAFESWYGLDYALIYFPDQGKFLSPLNLNLRYPLVNDVLAGSRGIFCTIPQKGDVTGGLYKVRKISPLSAEENKHDISASVTFNKAMDANVAISHEWFGYYSVGIRSKLPVVRPENMKKYVTSILGLTGNPADVVNYSFSNDDLSTYYTNKPLSLYASVNTPGLVNKAGNKYLIKAGWLIGVQPNDREEKKRTTPVEMLYPQSFNRTITINIPKGYRILNPEATKMSADYLNGELKNVISFNSDYKLVKDNKNGDKLVITVKEVYKQTHFPLFEYDRFRQVYNTSANFNNVTLVMVRR